MSLATRCSACGTVFRVVQDQLKVSEGWVRCGRCNEVFNALEGLFDLERDTPPEGTPDPLPVAAPAPAVLSDSATTDDDRPSSTADPIDRVESDVQAVACLFPPTDFLNWGKDDQNVLDMPNMAPFLAAFDFHELSAKTHRFERIEDRAKVKEIEKEISPIDHVTHHSPPTLIVHGDADNLVPIQQSQVFVDRMHAAHATAELSIKKGAGHGWIDAKSDLEHMADWFDKYLAK